MEGFTETTPDRSELRPLSRRLQKIKVHRQEFIYGKFCIVNPSQLDTTVNPSLCC